MKTTSFVSWLCASAMICAPVSAFAWKKTSCTQANAFSVLTNGPVVTAYVPNGAWYTGGTGIRVVTLEGASTAPTTIPTAGLVNACAADQMLQEIACTGNDNSVYLIKGTSLIATLHSSGTGYLGFSGGDCTNCSIAINTLAHYAYIEESVNYSPAVQVLDLRKQTFQTPFPLSNGISESIQVDTAHNLLLSASEYSSYDLVQLDASGAPSQEFGNYSVSAEYDASAEDCLSGLIVGTDEFTGNLYFASEGAATFDTATSTWSDPQQNLVYYPEFINLAAGTSGLSIAPGTHYAVIAGEFGGNVEGFMKLPGNGSVATAALQNYVIATLPNDPVGYAFQNGYDPHSESAYVSPSSGKSIALFADWASGSPDYLALVDIAAALAAPRVVSASGAPHEVNPTYNLMTNNVVQYVRTY